MTLHSASKASPSRRYGATGTEGPTPGQRMAAVIRRGLVSDAPHAWQTATTRRNPLMDPRPPRLLDAVLAGFLIADGIGVPGLGIPLGELAGILLLVVAAFRRPERSLSRYGAVAAGAAILVAYLVMVSIVNDEDPTRRAVRMVILMLLVAAFAQQRLDLRAAIFGMATLAAINVPLFYAGLAPDRYGGYLTGLMGDKNVAGMVYALLPLLLVATARSLRTKLLFLSAGIVLTFLTGSRTSLAALACAAVWVFLTPYLGAFLRLVLIGVMGWVVTWAENNLADLAVFGDRTGTDWFRDIIHEASWAKASAAPWYGEGLGTAVVEIPQGTYFFHNSYWGLLTEGGYVFVVAILTVYVLFGLRPFAAAQDRTPSRVAIEAATVVIFVVALQLGEVFITLMGAMVVACGLLLHADESDPQDLAAKAALEEQRIRDAANRRTASLRD
ncbi:MAG: hypothetical protein Q4G34_00535 [Micrococcus sp.]|nr:hypothetical protein [Micrococcus sp.]